MAETLEELHAHIEQYIAIQYEKKVSELDSIFVGSWAIIINVGQLIDGYAKEYWTEHYPQNMPPHALEGLYTKGNEIVTIGLEDDD